MRWIILISLALLAPFAIPPVLGVEPETVASVSVSVLLSTAVVSLLRN